MSLILQNIAIHPIIYNNRFQRIITLMPYSDAIHPNPKNLNHKQWLKFPNEYDGERNGEMYNILFLEHQQILKIPTLLAFVGC